MFRAILTLLALVIASDAEAQSATITPGEGFEVELYAVTLRPDLATTAVSGSETIMLRVTSDRVTQLAFSANALRVSGAMVDAAPVVVSPDKDALVFKLPSALHKGERATLSFRMDGLPRRGVTAVRGAIYTSYFACDWMVCLQDSPGDKAHLALDLFLPAGVESIGVGRAGPRTALPDGLLLHRWRSTRPYSSYVFAFAAGSFSRSSARSTAGELVYFGATADDADLPALFAQAPGMATFFADKAGLPLPDRRYAQVLVPGREAQESASFSLIGRAELNPERYDPSSAWIIAHEMAHQWWGNLVTCATWQDFWLNEGITTFMTAAWKEHRYGRAAYEAELDVARSRLDKAREIGFDKPLAWNGRYPNLRTRRAVQYSKGALFMDHLRTTLGDTAIWSGLRRYTRDHAGGTVTSIDLQRAMEAASGRDLRSLFAEWVYGEQPATVTNSGQSNQ